MNNYKSKSFSQKIKKRIRLLRLTLILMITYMVIVGEAGWGDSRYMTDLADTVSTLIFFGGLIYVIVRIVKNKKLLNDKQLRMSKLREEMDERQQFIHQKSGGIVLDILLLVLLFTTCTAALINMPAFYLSLAILVTTLFLKFGSYIVFSRKF